MNEINGLSPSEIALFLAKRRFAALFPVDEHIDPMLGLERAKALLERMKIDEMRVATENA